MQARTNTRSLSFSHTHTHTHTHKQHQGGKTTLGPGDSQSSRKHLQGFEVRMRTLGNYGVPSPENKAYEKKRHTCAIRLYTVILHTHLETLKRSAADTHTHTHTHALGCRQANHGKQNSPWRQKNMEYEGQSTRGILRSTSNEYISEGWR